MKIILWGKLVSEGGLELPSGPYWGVTGYDPNSA